MGDKNDEFEDLLDKEFQELENLLEKHYAYAKDYRSKFDADSIRLITERLKIAKSKLLNFHKSIRYSQTPLHICRYTIISRVLHLVSLHLLLFHHQK